MILSSVNVKMNSKKIVSDKSDIKMTKIQCKICELLGENMTTREHGLSDPCHLSSLHHLNSLSGIDSGLNFIHNTNLNYANHGLLNGLYLPQLKDMMLAAYLLRGKFVLWPHERYIYFYFPLDIRQMLTYVVYIVKKKKKYYRAWNLTFFFKLKKFYIV